MLKNVVTLYVGCDRRHLGPTTELCEPRGERPAMGFADVAPVPIHTRCGHRWSRTTGEWCVESRLD